MNNEQLHDGPYLRIFWEEGPRIIGIEWKETTAAMTTDEFKAALTLFATHVESKKAPSILVEVPNFRPRVQPEMQQWRVQNISTRYNSAGVKRFAFLFPAGAQIPAAMNQSAPEEKFQIRAFDDRQTAEAWLTAPE